MIFDRGKKFVYIFTYTILLKRFKLYVFINDSVKIALGKIENHVGYVGWFG